MIIYRFPQKIIRSSNILKYSMMATMKKERNDKTTSVCIIGLGYMGLPTALLLAKNGVKVLGYDINKKKIGMIKNGKMPFNEKGLAELYKAAKNNFSVTTTITKNTSKDIKTYIISVPTPFSEMKKCDLSYVIDATNSVKQILKRGDLVILESTVGPGTTSEIIKPLLEKSGLKCGTDFFLSYVSEKAIPGNTLYEMVNNARIIGGIDKESTDRTMRLYSKFVKGEIILTDTTTSEITKLVENTYRDVNIAFANELAKICDRLNINVWDVITYANKHPRVNIHLPGPGVGGHCIAIDPWFLVGKGSSDLIWTARTINDAMPQEIFTRLRNIILSKQLTNPKIAVLGVAYKKNVDDGRETPALPFIEMCMANDWKVEIHDPYVKDFHYPINRDIVAVLKDSDIVVITTDHDYYKDIDFSSKIVLDTKNMKLKAKEYYLLGYNSLNPKQASGK